MVLVLDQDFTDGLSRFDGTTGVWTTESSRGRLLTNSAETVFIDPDLRGAPWSEAPQTVVEAGDGLSLRTVRLPNTARIAIQSQMLANGRDDAAPQILFGAGRITTADTWAQTYGWFEMEAMLPVGRGRWPAFWLTFAGRGWPPEITIFEAYGRGIANPTPKDHQFNTSVHFDRLDENLEPVFDVGILNHFADDVSGQEPERRNHPLGEVYKFAQENFSDQIGLDMYGEFNTYAVHWTEDEIAFFVGPNRDNLTEVFRTPTPQDLHDPLYIIANDQFTMRGGHWPADRALGIALAPANDFLIKSIKVWAPTPPHLIRLGADQEISSADGSIIEDTSGDDVFSPGDGFDIIRLSGGADQIHISRGREGKVIHGFGPDDRLFLDGFTFESSEAAFQRLTQVGSDVWLSSGADPFWPQSIIFRDTSVASFRPEQIVSRWPVETNIWETRLDMPTEPLRDEDGDGLLQPDQKNVQLSDGGRPTSMYGSAGSDRYFLSHPKSAVIEADNGGVDTVIFWGDGQMPMFVERGILRGENGRITGTDEADRLEVEGVNGTLRGGAGNDLYVIHPTAQTPTIWVDEAEGHDVIRGFGPASRLEIDRTLRVTRASWSWVQEHRGVRVVFNEKQSLLIEGAQLADDGGAFRFR